jgi:hypothetical protein
MTVTQLSELGRRGCECIGCLRLFRGVEAFDIHRIGRHGLDRHCASDEEMAKAGLQLDERGVWFDATGRQKAADRRGRTPGAAELDKQPAAAGSRRVA